MPDGGRTRRLGLAAAALAIVAVAAYAWRPRPREAAPPPAAARNDALVLAADPGVERSSAGGWTPARPGDALGVTDSVRTGGGSTAEIELGRGSRVTLAESSEVTVRELTAAAHRVGLVRGRIGVDHRPDGTRVLRVEDQSGAVAASGSAGRFGFVAAAGGLGIAATEGQLTVESGGTAVVVPTGTETVAWRGAAPLPPRPIPREVVLHVARLLEQRRASVCLVLNVDVASELSVNGAATEIPRDGVVVVRLPPGARRRGADVVVRHATGLVERQKLPCSEDEGEVSDLEVRWNAR